MNRSIIHSTTNKKTYTNILFVNIVQKKKMIFEFANSKRCELSFKHIVLNRMDTILEKLTKFRVKCYMNYAVDFLSSQLVLCSRANVFKIYLIKRLKAFKSSHNSGIYCVCCGIHRNITPHKRYNF